MSDLNTFSATDAQKFFDEYYVPSNMVVAVVGDVKPGRSHADHRKIFRRIPSHAKPDERTTTEPPQNSERRVVLQEMAQPLYLEGYHRPDYRSPDDAVYDAIADLMSERPHLAPVPRAGARQENCRRDSAGFCGLPGDKYPHLFAFYAFRCRATNRKRWRRHPRRDRSPEERRTSPTTNCKWSRPAPRPT